MRVQGGRPEYEWTEPEADLAVRAQPFGRGFEALAWFFVRFLFTCLTTWAVLIIVGL